MESVALISFVTVFIGVPAADGSVRIGLAALWLGHYTYRGFVFPLRMPPGGRPMPLATLVSAVAFNTVNGASNAYALAAASPHLEAPWLRDPRFMVGLALFATGLGIHLHADGVLRRLRRSNPGAYRVPRGGTYRWVSCPNYLGEWVQWCGWALACWNLAAAAFAFFTFANLAPRARSHHRWYRREFPDYPPERRAFLPGLF